MLELRRVGGRESKRLRVRAGDRVTVEARRLDPRKELAVPGT